MKIIAILALLAVWLAQMQLTVLVVMKLMDFT
jgi:hypothetical protein